MLKKKTREFAVLPLRDLVVFPMMVVPLFVGRSKSIKAIEEVVGSKKQLVLLTQKNPSVDQPKKSDMYDIGVVGNVIQLLKLPDNTIKILVEAQKRVKIKDFYEDNDYYKVLASDIREINGDQVETEALMRSLLGNFEVYIDLNKKVNPEILSTVQDLDNPSLLVDTITSHIAISVQDKQNILSTLNVIDRIEALYIKLESEINILNTEKKIKNRVKQQMEKTQKDYYLNEQMKAIQKEISEGDDGRSEFDELEDKLKNSNLSKEAHDRVKSEIKKLRMMSAMSAEASILRNYIDNVLALPWKKKSKLKTDLDRAKKILDGDHYGLEKIKDRVIEYLAVNKRQNKLKGPIICLVGPPGVGKTSLAKSIAEATGRKFVKFSLGGMRDEAEIRGHRKTYIGAMTGKILQLIKKVQSSNPVMLLDEIDKIGSDFRGDPSFALLEVLDPEQNSKFLDHYLELEYDLSDVMFVATANSLDIPRPLLDRMEVIRLSGYTENEKLQIAKNHLIEKQMVAHGLKKREITFDDSAVLDIIRFYTREAGVRNLEKEIAKISRKVLKEILQDKIKSVQVDSSNLDKYLGVKKYDFGKAEEISLVGVTTGLAYTEVGGELLSIEAVVLPGKGDIKLTGKLGSVMQESAQAAFSYFKSNSGAFGIKPTEYQKRDIHIHAPEGATPKDGPSAGIAMFTSIVSSMTNIPVDKSVAMTGEITLRGRVLPIGGLKEKLLAAQRGGIKTVIIPQENKKDLSEISSNIIEDLKIITVSSAVEVLDIALVQKPSSIKVDFELEDKLLSREVCSACHSTLNHPRPNQ